MKAKTGLKTLPSNIIKHMEKREGTEGEERNGTKGGMEGTGTKVVKYEK